MTFNRLLCSVIAFAGCAQRDHEEPRSVTPQATASTPADKPAQPTPPPAAPTVAPTAPAVIGKPTDVELDAFVHDKTMGFSASRKLYAAFTVPEVEGHDWTARAVTFEGPGAPSQIVFDDQITSNYFNSEESSAKRKFWSKHNARLRNALDGFSFVSALPILTDGAPLELPGANATLTVSGRTVVVVGARRVEHRLDKGERVDGAFLFNAQHELVLVVATPNEEFSPTHLVVIAL